MTNYINPDVESDLKLKRGLHAEAFVYAMLNERLGLAGELLYISKGVKAVDNINLHYITLPLHVQHKLRARSRTWLYGFSNLQIWKCK